MSDAPHQVKPSQWVVYSLLGVFVFVAGAVLIPYLMGTPLYDAFMEVIQLMGCCLVAVLLCVGALIQLNRLVG